MLLTAPGIVIAQTAGTGALTGTVTDSGRAVVPGAQVKVTNEATGEARGGVTQDNGSYMLLLLLRHAADETCTACRCR